MTDKQKNVRLVTVPQHEPEAWVFGFKTASKHARVERVETCHGSAHSYGVLYVMDRGVLELKHNPETNTIEEHGGHELRVVLVPLMRGPTPVPDGCARLLGSFSDDRRRWLVFSVANETPEAGASAPRWKASDPGKQEPRRPPRGAQPASTTPSGTSPRPTGKPTP